MRLITQISRVSCAIAFGLAVVAIAASSAAAQRESSIAAPGFEATGGFVNFVEGGGQCLCARQAAPGAKQPVSNGDAIEFTGGRAEIVMIPGYYVRFSPQTVARLLDLTPDNLKIEIRKGSAILEIAVEPDLPFRTPRRFQDVIDNSFNIVTVVTPSGDYAVTKAGAYRFDVTPNASSVRVLKGSVVTAGRTVTDGNVASVMAGAIDVHSAAKTSDDAFDAWSRSRAAALVQSNKSLKQSDWYKKMQHGGYLDILRQKPPDVTTGAHVISARSSIAGFVESGVEIKSGKEDWHELKSGAELADGDRVRTSAHARAQIFPYPDFDLYLDGGSDFDYSVNADGDISIRVHRGSVALFVLQTNPKAVDRNILKLKTDNAEYAIAASGYYRLNVAANSESEMLVYAGSVVSAGGSVGSVKRIRVHGESRTVSSLDKDSRDSFDVWSAHRNVMGRFGDSNRRGWSQGLWFLNPATSEYTFVPAEWPWKSPYGGEYSTTYSLNREGFRMESPRINRSRMP